ncbi:MAG: transcriptional regulator [Paraburkholderia sp.]|nr:transcriptional regulator [Paraburkholderia sp.]
MNAPIRYKGYEVAPSAQRLPNGLYAANLTIGTLAANPAPSQTATASGTPPGTSDPSSAPDPQRSAPRGALVSFDALDYFFDERHALAYACRWARMWIDEQRRCA